jgi:adenosylcobinamide amidohydrolase
MIVTFAVFALVVVIIIIVNRTLSLAGLALAVVIATLARAAFDLAKFFTLPLSSSSSSPHS